MEAEEWAYSRKRDVLSEQFLKSLHKRMFGRVWRWAGDFRQTERNIGVDPFGIAIGLRNLLDDCRYWIEYETYPPDAIAARFHHLAVQGLVLSCVLVVSIIPLVRWAGALIGGRYAWWLEYHLLLSESSTR